jgi:hypothetical protein
MANKSSRARTKFFRYRRRSSPVDRKRRAGAIAPRFGRHLAGYRSSTTRPSRRAGCRRRNARSSPRSGGRSPRRLREPRRITHAARRGSAAPRAKPTDSPARTPTPKCGDGIDMNRNTQSLRVPTQGRRNSMVADAVSIRERATCWRRIGSPVRVLACSLLIRTSLGASQLGRKVL